MVKNIIKKDEAITQLEASVTDMNTQMKQLAALVDRRGEAINQLTSAVKTDLAGAVDSTLKTMDTMAAVINEQHKLSVKVLTKTVGMAANLVGAGPIVEAVITAVVAKAADMGDDLPTTVGKAKADSSWIKDHLKELATDGVVKGGDEVLAKVGELLGGTLGTVLTKIPVVSELKDAYDMFKGWYKQHKLLKLATQQFKKAQSEKVNAADTIKNMMDTLKNMTEPLKLLQDSLTSSIADIGKALEDIKKMKGFRQIFPPMVRLQSQILAPAAA